MSAQVKKAGRIGTKIVAAFLFVFLVMFNVQIGMHDGESSDINLFGLKLSVFIPTALASWFDGCEVNLVEHRCEVRWNLGGRFCIAGHSDYNCHDGVWVPW